MHSKKYNKAKIIDKPFYFCQRNQEINYTSQIANDETVNEHFFTKMVYSTFETIKIVFS